MLKNRRRFLYLILLAIITSNSKAQVTIGQGVFLVADSGSYVNVSDLSVSNQGSVRVAPGALLFSGSSPAESTYLESLSPLPGITLQKSGGGGLSLRSDVLLTNVIRLQGGILDLNRHDLDLGDDGRIEGENNATYITGTSGGYVIRHANLNAPQGVDAGNLGLQITTAADMGETLIRRSHVQPTSATGYGIYRYFRITPQNNDNLDATVKFRFLDGELAGISKEELRMWSSFDKGITWSLLGADAVDADNNVVTKSGISSLRYLTLGSDQDHALPLHLLSLTAVPDGSGADVKWTTTQEVNMSLYEVEKSDDGTTFTRFAAVAARGGGTTTQHYVATDQTPLYGTRYYRLKEVAKDGTVSYSAIVSLAGGGFRNQLLALYPNPVIGPVHVRFTSVKEQPVVLQITNATGQLIALKRITVVKGVNEIVFDAGALAAGMYYVKLDNISHQTIPFFKSGK